MTTRKAWNPKDPPGFREAVVPGNRPSRDSSAPRMARQFDPDSCPPGYDGDVWDLALYWTQLRNKYLHPGPGTVIVYAELERAVRTHAVREMKLRNATDSDPAWVRLLKLMIGEFWDHEMNPSQPAGALNDFVSAGMFTGLRDTVLTRANGRRIADRMDAERADAAAKGEHTKSYQEYLDHKAERMASRETLGMHLGDGAVVRSVSPPDTAAVLRALMSDEAQQKIEKVRVRLRKGEKLGDIIRERREGEK